MSKAPAKPAADAPVGKSKKKLFIMIGVAVLLLAGIGGVAMFMLSGKKNTKEKEHKEEVTKAPVFLPLEQFIVNLQSESGEKYLQVQMTLRVPDDAQANAIKANAPQVKSRLIMLLSSKDASELLTPEGKEKLIREITTQVNLPFTPKGEPQQVSDVFFTSFVIQ